MVINIISYFKRSTTSVLTDVVKRTPTSIQSLKSFSSTLRQGPPYTGPHHRLVLPRKEYSGVGALCHCPSLPIPPQQRSHIIANLFVHHPALSRRSTESAGKHATRSTAALPAARSSINRSLLVRGKLSSNASK